MKLLTCRWKVGLETRVSPFHQVFSRFMENGSRRSFKAKHLQGFFNHVFLMNFSLGRNIFPTFLPKLTSRVLFELNKNGKNMKKHRGPETFFGFDRWSGRNPPLFLHDRGTMHRKPLRKENWGPLWPIGHVTSRATATTGHQGYPNGWQPLGWTPWFSWGPWKIKPSFCETQNSTNPFFDYA